MIAELLAYLVSSFWFGVAALIGMMLYDLPHEPTMPIRRRGNLSSPPPNGMCLPPRAMFTSGYQPTLSTTDPSNPPKGGSGVPLRAVSVPGKLSQADIERLREAWKDAPDACPTCGVIDSPCYCNP